MEGRKDIADEKEAAAREKQSKKTSANGIASRQHRGDEADRGAIAKRAAGGGGPGPKQRQKFFFDREHFRLPELSFISIPDIIIMFPPASAHVAGSALRFGRVLVVIKQTAFEEYSQV